MIDFIKKSLLVSIVILALILILTKMEYVSFSIPTLFLGWFLGWLNSLIGVSTFILARITGNFSKLIVLGQILRFFLILAITFFVLATNIVPKVDYAMSLILFIALFLIIEIEVYYKQITNKHSQQKTTEV